MPNIFKIGKLTFSTGFQTSPESPRKKKSPRLSRRGKYKILTDENVRNICSRIRQLNDISTSRLPDCTLITLEVHCCEKLDKFCQSDEDVNTYLKSSQFWETVNLALYLGMEKEIENEEMNKLVISNAIKRINWLYLNLKKSDNEEKMINCALDILGHLEIIKGSRCGVKIFEKIKQDLDLPKSLIISEFQSEITQFTIKDQNKRCDILIRLDNDIFALFLKIKEDRANDKVDKDDVEKLKNLLKNYWILTESQSAKTYKAMSRGGIMTKIFNISKEYGVNC